MYPPEFLIIPYQLVNDDKIQPLDETLYGVIYWLTQLKGEKCTAGNTTLAEICRTTPACVQNSLGRLEKREYIARIFKDKARKVRKEIIPLIVFTKVSLNNDRGRKVSSTDDTVSSGDDRRVSSGDDQNKSSPINKSSNNTSPSKDGGTDKNKKQSLEEFIKSCKSSLQRHIQIIGEWAEAEQPEYTTKSQWQRYVKRNLRAAKDLTPFSTEELQKAYDRMLEDVIHTDDNGKKVGFLSKYTLETLSKYM